MQRALGRVVSIALLGCASESEKSPESASSTANVVALASVNNTFESPDTISAGWTTLQFANKGEDVHYAHFVQLAAGRTASELVRAYAEAIRTSGPRPDWLTRFGGPGGAIPGGSATVTQYMEPGTYALVCPIEDSTGTPHFEKGEYKTVVVNSSGSHPSERGAPPNSTTSIRLLDYGFAVDSQLTAGEHTIHVSNAGADAHDLVMMKLAPGITLEDVSRSMNPEAARRTDNNSKPPVPFEQLGVLVGGIATIRPGMDVFFTISLTSGDHVLLCMATAPDGRSHIEHGMVQRLIVK